MGSTDVLTTFYATTSQPNLSEQTQEANMENHFLHIQTPKIHLIFDNKVYICDLQGVFVFFCFVLYFFFKLKLKSYLP